MLNDDGHCFACGKDNPQGLHLAFEQDGERLRTRHCFSQAHQGWAGVVHGGLLSLVLDETMVNLACKITGLSHVSAELNIRFLKPAKVGENIAFEAWLEGPRRRLMVIHGTARDEQGNLLAEAHAKCLRV